MAVTVKNETESTVVFSSFAVTQPRYEYDVAGKKGWMKKLSAEDVTVPIFGAGFVLGRQSMVVLFVRVRRLERVSDGHPGELKLILPVSGVVESPFPHDERIRMGAFELTFVFRGDERLWQEAM